MENTRPNTRGAAADDADTEPLSIANRGESDSTTPREEMIARRAYQRFEERGREHGRDVEDWLEAERDVRDESNQ